MFSIDDKQIVRMEKDLKLFAKKAYPFASKNTVNESAFFGQKKARQIVKRRFINRNKWTIQSIQVEKTNSLNPRNQMAILGSTMDYMEEQEFGSRQYKQGKKGVTIPTAFSAGMSTGSRPRTRLPRRANKMQNIRLRHRRTKGKTRRQRNLIAVMSAATSGQKYVFLDLGNKQGIFKVTGGRRAPQVKMVHDLSRQSITINPRPWLGPAVKRTINKVPEIYKKSLLFQLRKQKIFDY